jgi:hypothetical protein
MRSSVSLKRLSVSRIRRSAPQTARQRAQIRAEFHEQDRYQLLQRELVFGDYLNDSFQAVESLAVSFGGHNRILSHGRK